MIKRGRERQKTEVRDSMCINLLFITPRVRCFIFTEGAEGAASDRLHLTVLLFLYCSLHKVHSIPETSLSHQMPRRFLLFLVDEVKLQPRHSKTLKESSSRACGSVNTLECSRAKPLSGQTSRRWFLWRPLPVHLNKSLYT